MYQREPTCAREKVRGCRLRAQFTLKPGHTAPHNLLLHALSAILVMWGKRIAEIFAKFLSDKREKSERRRARTPIKCRDDRWTCTCAQYSSIYMYRIFTCSCCTSSRLSSAMIVFRLALRFCLYGTLATCSFQFCNTTVEDDDVK